MNMQISELNELNETGRQTVRPAGPHMINNAVNFNENSMENSTAGKTVNEIYAHLSTPS